MKNSLLYKNINIYFYTSYFYTLRFLNNYQNKTNSLALPVSICLWDPKWFKEKNFYNYKGFVPRKYNAEEDCEKCIKEHKNDYLYNGGLNCSYIRNYKKQLNYYNFERTLDDLLEKIIRHYNVKIHNDISNSSNSQVKIECNGCAYDSITIFFLGYEVPDKKCSERFTLAKWFENNVITNSNCERNFYIPEWDYKNYK